MPPTWSLDRRSPFTQDFFDWLCVDLNDVEIARAVAASSAVPLIFSPITQKIIMVVLAKPRVKRIIDTDESRESFVAKQF